MSLAMQKLRPQVRLRIDAKPSAQFQKYRDGDRPAVLRATPCRMADADITRDIAQAQVRSDAAFSQVSAEAFPSKFRMLCHVR